jgi:hypothetical protein
MTMNVATNSEHICSFCNKAYKNSAPFDKHLIKCKKKYETKRYFERLEHCHDTPMRIGYYVYLKYYEQFKSKKTLAQFLNSFEYKGFVRFGNFCLSIDVIHIDKFADYIINKDLKLNQWVNKSIYTEYIYDLTISEPAIDALERTIQHSVVWGEKYGVDGNNIIRSSKGGIVCYYIISGLISPWVLYLCSSGIEFLNELDEESLETIWSFVNSKIWELKMDAKPSDVEYIKLTLEELGW